METPLTPSPSKGERTAMEAPLTLSPSKGERTR
jgi:hypothetical protein